MSIEHIMKQSQCPHNKLQFGSGDYYVFCASCLRTWVKIRTGTGDEPCSENLNNDISGEERIKIPTLYDEKSNN